MGEIQKHQRRSIRLPGYDYARMGDYFVTIVTKMRRPIFGMIVDGKVRLNHFGEIANRFWVETSNHFLNVELGPYVIMSNHFHAIITINDNMGWGTACCAPTADGLPEQRFGKIPPNSLPAIVRSYKSAATRQMNQCLGYSDDTVWQRNYYEHIIASDEEYARIAAYIDFNPDNWMIDEENPDRN